MWLSWCLYFSFGSVQSTLWCQKCYDRGEGCRVDTRSTSLCSMSCIDVDFSNEALPSVCREQLTISATAWVILLVPWDFFFFFFCQLIKCKPILVLETLFSDKIWTVGALSLPLFVNLIYIAFIYVYILGSFWVVDFQMTVKKPLVLIVPPHIFFFTLSPTPLDI